jgi:hypothetical protein
LSRGVAVSACKRENLQELSKSFVRRLLGDVCLLLYAKNIEQTIVWTICGVWQVEKKTRTFEAPRGYPAPTYSLCTDDVRLVASSCLTVIMSRGA